VVLSNSREEKEKKEKKRAVERERISGASRHGTAYS